MTASIKKYRTITPMAQVAHEAGHLLAAWLFGVPALATVLSPAEALFRDASFGSSAPCSILADVAVSEGLRRGDPLLRPVVSRLEWQNWSIGRAALRRAYGALPLPPDLIQAGIAAEAMAFGDAREHVSIPRGPRGRGWLGRRTCS